MADTLTAVLPGKAADGSHCSAAGKDHPDHRPGLPQSTLRRASLGCDSSHGHLLQAVFTTETQVTTRTVQMTAATKQAEKLSKGLVKTQQEVDEALQGMEAKQQEQQARRPHLGPYPSCTAMHQLILTAFVGILIAIKEQNS